MNVLLLTVAGELERALADLYPYRVPLTAAAVAMAAGAAVVLVRLGAIGFLSRHRLPMAIAAVPAVVIAVVAGNYLLSPLWERSYLEEASPLAMAMPQASGSMTMQVETMTNPAAAMPGPRVTHEGEFRGADDFHFGRGRAVLIAADDGDTVLRLEGFSVRNGPDLYVYLSRDEKPTRVDEKLNLGRLKATDGDFNYELADGIDLAGAKSVIVWCRQFGVLFASAPLQPL